MNITIIYEPYIFSLLLSLIISIIYYLYEKNKIDDIDFEEDEEIPENNLLSKSVIVLLFSYIVIMIVYYSYKYLSFDGKKLPETVMVGGAATRSILKEISKDDKDNEELKLRREKMMERLTIVDDDVDVSILEN